MPKQLTVNDLLLIHMFCGGKVASVIRNHVSTWKDVDLYRSLSSFFESDNDWDRLQHGRQVAKIFLRRHDMEYMLPLWNIVNVLEQGRRVKYLSQTDHTLHSIFLYMLGIWFFDHSSEFRKLYKSYNIMEPERQRYLRCFSQQWIFASLLHDVGYVFDNLKDEWAKENLSKVDKYFSERGFKWQFSYMDGSILRKVWQQAQACVQKWISNGDFPDYSSAKYPADIIIELDKVPWLGELDGTLPTHTTEAFEQFPLAGRPRSRMRHKPAGMLLKEYATTLAAQGYDGSGNGVVEHAFASGCLLFQLSSFKHWLILGPGRKFKDAFGRKGDVNRFPGFTYDLRNLLQYILPACHAAAAHNVLSVVPCSKKMIPYKINFSPLLFLSVLCDELQKWQRPPIGTRYIKGQKVYLRPKVKEVHFEVNELSDGERISVNFLNNKVFKEIFECLERLDQGDLRRLLGYMGYGDKLNLAKEIDELLKEPEP